MLVNVNLEQLKLQNIQSKHYLFLNEISYMFRLKYIAIIRVRNNISEATYIFILCLLYNIILLGLQSQAHAAVNFFSFLFS